MENSSKIRVTIFKSIILFCIYNGMDFQVKGKNKNWNGGLIIKNCNPRRLG